MSEYRMYRLNDSSRIMSRFEFEAIDDRTALHIADEQCDGRGWELWQLSRKVATARPSFMRAVAA